MATDSVIVKSRDSLLTTTSGYTNYRGILNLVIILLVLSNARAALENIIKYGILVDPLSWFIFLGEGSKHWPALLILAILGLNILISLTTEKLVAILCGYQPLTSNKTQASSSPASKIKQNASNTAILWAANLTLVLNLLACLSLPPIAVYSHETHPISTSAALMLVSIVFLKLVSYHMINFWCRDVRRPEKLQSRTTRSFLRSYIPPAVDFGVVVLDTKKPVSIANNTNGTSKKEPQTDPPVAGKQAAENGGELRHRQPSRCSSQEETQSKMREEALKVLARYPSNINFANMCSFITFPTLCYEIQFAQTERIRKRFLIKRLVELIILSQLDVALVQQWIVPTVSNSVLPFRQMQLSHMLERLLKLAIPNHVIWLIWFYLFFHSLLNIIAELTRFADREFYRDWWNSESVYYFWSNWNLPVHKWCARHLYVPLIALGLSKCQASTAVFCVSAFFHEYLVSVPLKMFRMWAFTGMLMQLPWARFVSYYFNNHFANVAVWVSLIIGQPLCILMYYHDYYVIHNVPSYK